MKVFWLILHFLGLAMTMGSGLSMMVLQRLSQKMPADEKDAFLMKTLPVMKLGSYGLLLLIISGIAMAIPLWPFLKTAGLFHGKLLFVFVAALLLGFNQMFQAKIKKENNLLHLKKVILTGRLIALTNFIIVILAVLVFR